MTTKSQSGQIVFRAQGHPDGGVNTLAERVVRILVASWKTDRGINFRLWRFVRRTSGFDFEGTIRFKFEIDYPGHSGEVTVLPFEVGDLSVEIDYPLQVMNTTYRALRWVLPILGMIERGVPVLPPAIRNMSNPFIGRFRGQTKKEVLEDAAALDGKIWDYLAEIAISKELFQSDGVYLVRKKRPETNLFRWGLFAPDSSVLGSVDSRERSIVPIVNWLETTSLHPTYAVFPGEAADRWWRENELEGEPSVPLEELELYAMLGERCPFLWPTDRVSEWAIDRWGGP